jgi:hypothetical protein
MAVGFARLVCVRACVRATEPYRGLHVQVLHYHGSKAALLYYSIVLTTVLLCSVIFTSVERPRKASDEIYWIPKRLTGEHKQGSTRLVASLLSMAVISVHLSDQRSTRAEPNGVL